MGFAVCSRGAAGAVLMPRLMLCGIRYAEAPCIVLCVHVFMVVFFVDSAGAANAVVCTTTLSGCGGGRFGRAVIKACE